jgi:hypothetical protein
MYRVFSKLRPYKLPARHCNIDLRKNKRFIIIIYYIEQVTKEPAARLVTLREHKYSLLPGSHIGYCRENILKEAPAFFG